MNDRPASWRMPTRRQMDQLARRVGGKDPNARGLAPNADLPPEYWEALLEAAGADGDHVGLDASRRLLRLSQVPDHVLRVGCRRCGRTVEIQKADAARLYGPESVWRDVGRRLLDDTCTQRTGRYEEDGCWPSFG